MSSVPHRPGARPRASVLFLALAVAAAACASTKTAAAPPPTTTGVAGFPVTIGTVTVRARPTAIISLSPTATEDLFAIGAGSQVIAVDDQSDYPASAPKTSLSGYKPNIEAIAAKRPDLVIVADDSSGVSGALAKLAIPTLVEDAAANLEGAYAQIEQLGTATGHAQAAVALVTSMRASIASTVAAQPHRATAPRIYHEVDQTFYSATSKTFIGQLYTLLGARDIADAADSQGSGYPQLSPEYIVKADPDVIFLADSLCCGQTPSTVAARPGWSVITAVESHAIVTLNDDVASRWGPRVVDLVKAIAAGLALAPPGTP